MIDFKYTDKKEPPLELAEIMFGIVFIAAITALAFLPLVV